MEHDEIPYNEVAVRVMKKDRVAIDDLYALAVAQKAKVQRPNNVPFTPEGYEALAVTVVARITPALPAPPK
jgi:acyl-CoA thioesterase-1